MHYADSPREGEEEEEEATRVDEGEGASESDIGEEEEEANSDEEQGVLRRVLSFVWEAETDYHSYYSKKKEQKKRRKERLRKKEKKQKKSLQNKQRFGADASSILDMRLTSRGGMHTHQGHNVHTHCH